MPSGRSPTGMVAALVAPPPPIVDTVAPSRFVTHTRLPSPSAATPQGPWPTETVDSTTPRARSITDTALPARSGTKARPALRSQGTGAGGVHTPARHVSSPLQMLPSL